MKLKLGLLSLILDNSNTPNKYTRAFLNLKNVFELEEKENFKFDKELIKKFNNIKEKNKNFQNEIPLKIIEKYYILQNDQLDEYIFIRYNGNEIADLRIIDLYVLLEDFFQEIFSLACEIADFYNLEIKINDNSQRKNEFL